MEIITRRKPKVWRGVFASEIEEADYIRWAARWAFHWAALALKATNGERATDAMEKMGA